MDSATDRRLEAPRQESSAGDRAGAPVPASYAERAMNSLMSLHASLVAEKDRTLDLTRRLMEARQGQAELESYVRLLEAEVARLGGPDLGEVHDGRADALGRASARVLDALRRGPGVQDAAAPRPAASPAGADSVPPAATRPPPAVAPPPGVSMSAHPGPAAPARSAPRPARAPGPRVPRPPRPSRRYRTKITAAAGPVRAEASPAPVAAPGAAPGTDLRDDDGWRQW